MIPEVCTASSIRKFLQNCILNTTHAKVFTNPGLGFLVDFFAGVESVNCDPVAMKVIVTGDAKPESVLKKVQKVRKDAKLVPKKK
jgi:hypothetical protein